MSIRKKYFDLKTGFLSPDKLSRKLELPRREVEEALERIDTHKLFKRPPVTKVYGKIFARGKNVKAQMDLIFADKIGIGVWKGHKFILSYIDVYSRRAVCIAIKDKKGSTIVEALKKVWRELRPPSLFLESDLGSEFSNKVVGKFLQEKNVKLKITTFAPIVERFNATIEKMMVKAMTGLKSKDWVRMLPILVKNYNETYHSSIKMSPQKAYDKGNVEEVMVVKKGKPKFKIGDRIRVRTSKNKETISATVRSYLYQWSKDIGRINKVLRSANGVYLYDVLWTETGQRGLHLIPETFMQKV